MNCSASNVQNVDLDNLVLRVNRKGSRQRLVPISMEGRKHLFRWLQTYGRGRGRWVFTVTSGGRMNHRNLYRDVVTLCQKIGVLARVHPHAFRHCFAVSYIRRGGDIYRLSRILGHASLSTTQIYLRSMGIEHLQEGHERFSPLSAC